MLDRYGLTLVSAPGFEPVTLAEVKAHLRVEITTDDALLTALIPAARKLIEEQYDRQLVTATWRLTLDAFPDWEISLPRGPLQSVSSVVYDEPTEGTATTLDPTAYRVEVATNRLEPAYGLTWPVPRSQAGAVRITYVAGYGDASQVPEPAKLAIKLLVAQWYEAREAAQSGSLSPIPFGVDALCQSIWSGVYA